MRRHQRNLDPYQTRERLSELFEQMKHAVYPKGVSDGDFKKLLYAVQYYERYPNKESKSGRRKSFDDAFLYNASLKLKSVLQAVISGRISLMRFISTYLPVFDYPSDLQTALNQHKINLEEARILNRINRENLGQAVKRKPSEIRKELIDSHLKRGGTQAELKNRVAERLNIVPKKQAENISANIAVIDAEVDQLLEFNEFDTEHLLWEEIKSLVFLMREVDSSIIDEDSTVQILDDLDSVKLKLLKFKMVMSKPSETSIPQEKAILWRKWTDSHDKDSPGLSDDAISRESMYETR